MTTDAHRAQEDAADAEQRVTLERHVAMRLTAIIKAEEATKRRQRTLIFGLVVGFVVVVLAAIIFLMVQLQNQADRLEKSNHDGIQRAYDICIKRNDQAAIISKLLVDFKKQIQGDPTLTASQRVKKLHDLDLFQQAFPVVDCHTLLR